MDKPIRKAVRCYLIKDNRVVVIKYKKGNKKGNKKAGYYDIPGGKIEEGETSEQTAIREMREETGLIVKNVKHKGKMIIEYPNRKFDFDIFITIESIGEPQEFKENTSEWIDINELVQNDKILSPIVILKQAYMKGLLEDKYNFSMYIEVDEQENILDVRYRMIRT